MSSESNNITTAPSSTDNNQHSTTSAVLPPSVRSPVFEKPREDLTSRLQKEFGLLVEADTSNSDLDQTIDLDEDGGGDATPEEDSPPPPPPFLLVFFHNLPAPLEPKKGFYKIQNNPLKITGGNIIG